MNAGSFIARRLGDKGNRISWISVALSIAVMVVAIAVVDGFKSEIRAKATGFMGSAALVPPG
ncbi:MAG: ABC transporter permease, partial [Bacteroidales bacterium]|nr:ABC transporter permease [Bacteroidales bacterium]